MFFIPGWLVELITFPGVIVHEIAHRIFCHLTGVPVYDVRYFKVAGHPSGYVIHGHPKNLRSAFLISIGPLIVNTLLCALLGFVGVVPILILNDAAPQFASGIMLWLGISIGMHAFPSNHDAREFAAQVQAARGTGVLYYIATLFSGLLTVTNFLRVIWFDAIYAIAVSFALPLAFGLN